MPKSAFDYKEYQALLHDRLSVAHGEVSRAAESVGCQRSYLSRVLAGGAHLTPDQAYALTVYWSLPQSESAYFSLLVEHSRAASVAYREHIERKLQALKRVHENLARRLERPPLEPGEKEISYYSAWYWSALHILVSIPKFQTVESISSKLQIDSETVVTTLGELERFGLVRRDGGKWKFDSGNLHLPKGALLLGLHHNNWRQRAVLHSQRAVDDGGVHYTAVQSMSRTAFEEIKSKLFSYIDETARIAGPSKEEELICLTCDLFAV